MAYGNGRGGMSRQDRAKQFMFFAALKVTGMVSRIDETARLLKIVDTKLPFEDLYEVSVQGSV